MKEIYIEKRNELRRIAIKEDNVLKECFIEEEINEPLPGEIYKGRVKNIVKGINCAFVDIGYEKNAYMYLDESISKVIKKGNEIIVEVIKEELGNKGAKVTPKFGIPGRYCVITEMGDGIKFSKKIENKEFIEECIKSLKVEVGTSIMIRTQGEKVSIDTINEEVKELYSKYNELKRKFNYCLNAKKLYGDSSILHKILRDNLSDDTELIEVDSSEDYEMMREYIDSKEDINITLKLYEGHRSLFDYKLIEKEILALRHNKVNLKCGGSIVIEKTEAMYVIDVNSGKNIGAKSHEKIAFTTNINASYEIIRQIRLRNLSGIIVIDFIDMDNEKDKNEVLRILREGFNSDKNKTIIYPHTELNLVQIARRRRGKNIYEYIEEPCKFCNGYGKKLKLSYLTLLIKNDILKKDGEGTIKDIHIEINEVYKDCVKGDIFNFVKNIDGFHKELYINFSNLVEYFKVEPLIFPKQIDGLKDFKVEFNKI